MMMPGALGVHRGPDSGTQVGLLSDDKSGYSGESQV